MKLFQSPHRWLAALLLMNLLLGVILGILVDQYLLTPAEAHPGPGGTQRPQGAGSWKPPSREHLVLRLDRELVLTQEQREAIGRLYDLARDREREWFQKQRGQFQEMRQGLFGEIEVLLTDEQKVKFQEMIKQMEQRRRNRMMSSEKHENSNIFSSSPRERRMP